MGSADDFSPDTTTTGVLTVGGHADGNFERGYDADWFAINLQAGTRYLFTVGATTGMIPFDGGYSAYGVQVFDANGHPVSVPLVGGDIDKPVLEFVPAVSGKYFISAASNYYWNGLGGYEVSAAVRTASDDYTADATTTAFLPQDGSVQGQFEVAGDQDWVRFHGEVGKHYVFTADGPAPGQVSDQTFPTWMVVVDQNGQVQGGGESGGFNPTVSGDYYLHLLGLRAGNYTLHSHTWNDDYPDNNTTQATLQPGQPIKGAFDYELDHDRFRLNLEAGKFYTIDLNAAPDYFQFDVLDASGTRLNYITGNTQGGSLGLVFHPTVSGLYYLDALHSLQNQTPTAAIPYTVSIDSVVNDDIGDGLADAAALNIGSVASGVLQASVDTDMFRVRLQAGVSYAFQLKSSSGVRDDLAFAFKSTNGANIANANTFSNGYTAVYKYTPSATDDYYLAVGTGTGGVHGYTVQALQLSSDSSPPVLVAATHPNGATGIALDDAVITLSFNEAITAIPGAITLHDSLGNTVYFGYDDGSGYPKVNDNKLFIKLNSYLTPGTYTLSLPHGSIQDLAGNAYNGPESMTFSTVQPVALGSSANDLLLGGTGGTIDGGGGLDTVSYGQYSYPSEYTITRDGAKTTVVHSSYPVATDTLLHVERLMFANSTYALDIDGNAGQAYRLYQAAFNRTPDATGLGFWISHMDQGLSLPDVAHYFMTSPEFQSLYGASPSETDYVNLLYKNVLHREADSDGMAFWLNAMHTSTSHEQVLAFFSESPENQAALATVIGNGFAYTPYYG